MSSIFQHIKLLQVACLASLLLVSLNVSASVYSPHQNREIIEKLYHKLDNNPKSDMAARLKFFSGSFIGKPYLLGALGEGSDSRYDQSPLYRTDAFDCETYVDTVVALALAANPKGFAQCINKIRYRKGQISFITRNHFTALDWNKNNQLQGFVKDITPEIKDKNNQPVMLMATALINKPAWYAHLNISRIQLFPQNKEEQSIRLLELQKKGHKLAISEENIPYIPLAALFDKEGRPDEYLFGQIPDASIIEIVRPNWNLEKVIGTNLNVSHLGFAFRINGKLMFREASSTEGGVVEISLIEYLRKLRSSPTIKGINIQIVAPTNTLMSDCLT